MTSPLHDQAGATTLTGDDQSINWTFEGLEREILLACQEFGMTKITVAVPVPLDDDTVRRLLALPEVESMILVERNEAHSRAFPNRIGWIELSRRRWRLPARVAGSLFFLGPRSTLTFEIGVGLVSRGIFRLIIRTSIGRARIRALGLGVKNALLLPLLRPAWRGVCQVGFSDSRSRFAFWLFQTLIIRGKIDRAIKPFLTGDRTALIAKDEFVPGRVMLVNSALAWGGAERQLVNTAIGLAARGTSDVIILCDNSSSVPDHDFYRWRLDAAGIEVRDLDRKRAAPAVSGPLAEEMESALQMLNFPGLSLGNEIGFYVREMLKFRPEVVHAWQDHTSVKAGIAAAIAGVPKIILSARNVAPYNFKYNLPYLHAGYKALLRGKNIAFLNNSSAGAADYARWLTTTPQRIRVIRNGFDFSTMTRKEEAAQDAFRRQSGIKEGAVVVGSVFRLYEEKDPLLWIRTAALIAEKRPDVVFLIIGRGLMRAEVVRLAEQLGIGNRVFLPGIAREPAVAYALMDVFLLTSRFEGLPNVLIEAQSLGVPVVATDVGGTRETVLEGRTGFVLESRDPEDLARKVLFALGDKDWRKAARCIAPSFIQERFGMDRMIDETLNVYGWAGSSSTLRMADRSDVRDAHQALGY